MAPQYKLLCLGNPLLDIQVKADTSLLDKYGLKPNDAILAEDKHKPIYEDLLSNYPHQLCAGGSAQNTARGAAYILGPDNVAYMGCVGKDKYAEILVKANTDAGLHAAYRYDDEQPTGRCGAILTGHDRSLCTDLAAANCFKIEHLKEHWKLAEEARVFFTTGFHCTVSPDSMIALGEHAAQTDKVFALSLSAPFIMQFFKDQLASVLPFTDYVLGAEEEFAAYGENNGITGDVVEVAKHVAALGKKNSKRARTVIVTRGKNDTAVVVQGQQGSKTYPVRVIDEARIKDTNGAGDAFAGGFLAGLVQGKGFEESLDIGQWLAGLEIQEDGPAYPQPKQTYSKA